MFTSQLLISGTISVTGRLNIDRTIVKLAVITTKADVPRLTASVITTCGHGASVTVKGVINSGLFGVLAVTNSYSLVRPVRTGGMGCVSLLIVLNVSILLLPLIGDKRGVSQARKFILVLFCIVCVF